MLLDATHRRWILGCLVALVVATAIYIPYARGALHGPSGGSWLGLAYGIAGLAMMIFAGVLGARRKVPMWRIGRGTTWMKGHLWLGLLSYPIILFHAGFQLGGALTLVIMVLFTLVVLSGIYGIILQQVLPRLMLTRLPLETVYEQIDAVVAQLRGDADELVGAAAGVLPVGEVQEVEARRGGGGLGRGETLVRPASRPKPAEVAPMAESASLKALYLSDIRPYLAREVPKNGRLETPAAAAALFQHLRMTMPTPLHDTVNELQALCDERRQLGQQKRLQHWLHGWLLVHVPLSYALLLLAIVHAVVSLRY